MPAVTLKAQARGQTLSARGATRGEAAHALAREMERLGLILDRKTLRTTGAVFRDPRRGFVRQFSAFTETGRQPHRFAEPAGRGERALERADWQQLAADLGYDLGVLDSLNDEQLSEVIRVTSHWRDEARKANPPQLDEAAADMEADEVRGAVNRFSEHFPRGTDPEVIVAGFKAEQKRKPGLSAREFLGGLAR